MATSGRNGNGWLRIGFSVGGLLCLLGVAYASGSNVARLNGHMDGGSIHKTDEQQRETIRQLHADLNAPILFEIKTMSSNITANAAKLDAILAKVK